MKLAHKHGHDCGDPFENSARSEALRCTERLGARGLQDRGPPEQILNHRPGGYGELGQAGLDISALVVSPQGGNRDVDWMCESEQSAARSG
jgi:hypothetical protein